jgi:hypothetical protein
MKTIVMSGLAVAATQVSLYGLIFLDGLRLLPHETARNASLSLVGALPLALPLLGVAVVAVVIRQAYRLRS